MIPIVYLVVGGAVLAAGGALTYAALRREPSIDLLPGTSLPPPHAAPPPRAAPPPPARAGSSDGMILIGKKVGGGGAPDKVCSFGIEEHCYWQPRVVKPLGLNRFEWGFCLAQWKDDLAAKEKGGIAFADKVISAILAIASALTLGLSTEAVERLCFRFQWKLRSYAIDGATYWAIRYVEPEKHILTGEIVKPPPNPVRDAAWVHETAPGDYPGGGGWSVPVLALFFSDGTYRDVVRQSDLRTAIREYELNPETVTDYAMDASGEKSKVVLSTKAKAERAYK